MWEKELKLLLKFLCTVEGTVRMSQEEVYFSRIFKTTVV
jgi:hypothetical protein